MRQLLVLGGVALLTACSRPATETPTGSGAVPPRGREHIPGIAQMNLSELTDWMQRCAPYAASPEARARSPYEPADCDEVVRRHTEWRTPSTEKPAAYLPGLH